MIVLPYLMKRQCRYGRPCATHLSYLCAFLIRSPPKAIEEATRMRRTFSSMTQPVSKVVLSELRPQSMRIKVAL